MHIYAYETTIWLLFLYYLIQVDIPSNRHLAFDILYPMHSCTTLEYYGDAAADYW